MHAVDTRDTRPSEIPDDTGRPSGVVAVPAASCGHTGVFRRDLCRSCYRKLWEADLLPPLAPGPTPVHPLRRWLASLDTATLLLLRGWLEEIERVGK